MREQGRGTYTGLMMNKKKNILKKSYENITYIMRPNDVNFKGLTTKKKKSMVQGMGYPFFVDGGH